MHSFVARHRDTSPVQCTDDDVLGCLLRCKPQMQTKTEYDKVIEETEAAYLKILESSQTLLHVLKRESVNIKKRTQASS
jgi:hypothetical protein